MLIVLSIPKPAQFAGGIGELLDCGEVLGVAGGWRAALAPPMVFEAIGGDRAKPMAKGAAPLRVQETSHLLHQHRQHFLRHIVGIGRWQRSELTQPLMNERRVDIDQQAPIFFGRSFPQAIQQA